MERTTSTEFVDWMRFLHLEMNSKRKEDYYLAQIAAEVRRSLVKKPQEVQVQDFLLNFVNDKGRVEKIMDSEEEENWMEESPVLMEESEIEEPPKAPVSRLQKSKNYWFALLGMDKK